MLQVEKELLVAETVREVAQMRQMELQYYVDNIGSIQTMATLLGGFAFTAFVSLDGGFDLKSLIFRGDSGEYDGAIDANGTIHVEPADEGFDAIQIVSFVMEVFQVVAVAFTLGEMLYVMTETLIARLLQDFPDRFGFSVSSTTRPPRAGEVAGTSYDFPDGVAVRFDE